MKVLHIITRLIVGGAQENTLLTCEGLHRAGHEVILLTGPSPGPEGTLLERAKASGYQVMVTPHLLRNPHPWHDWRAGQEIAALCAQIKPDVVHTHSSKAGIIGRKAAWRMNVPVIIHTIHGLPFHPFQAGWINKLWIILEARAARRCHGIISVADAMTRQALEAGVGTAEQFTTVYSGMEVGPFINPPKDRAGVREELGIPQDRIVFGTIARLQPLKGHADLLAIAGEIFKQVPQAHFLWIGDGVFRPQFEATLREKGWVDRFTLTGLVPPARVPELLPAMDVLVHPSYREGLARALPQALLAGVPVVSYDCDGAGEVCITGKTGELVKTGDAAALRDAMLRLAKKENRAELGNAGREFCMERFDARGMVRRIEEVYKKYLLPFFVEEGA